MQWTSRTPSQLRRSSELFEIIDKVKSILDMSNEKLFNRIIFDVMMTLIQLKMSFVDEISNIYKILQVILHLFNFAYLKYQPNNPIITINDTYDLSIDTVESVVFWIVFRLIYRFEIVNAHKNTKDNLFELVQIYVSHKIPFLHEHLVKKSDYLNIECLNLSAHCLFCDFFLISNIA